MRLRLVLLGAILALAGCGPGEDDPGPGGVTVGEARALDEAAAMLDAQRLPEGVLREISARKDPGEAAGESGPTEPAGTGASERARGPAQSR